MTDKIDSTVEEWRAIPGYEGLYEVSSLGAVRRIIGPRGEPISRIIKENKTKSGYAYLSLSKKGIVKTRRIHQLIASAFLGSCPDGMQINHIDFNRLNNSIRNLEYVTPKQNTNYSRENRERARCRGEEMPTRKLNDSAVVKIREMAQSGVFHREIAILFGVHPSTISKVCLGNKWKHVH